MVIDEYYAKTAAEYDQRHAANDEHNRAIRLLFAWLPVLGARTILDVGAGTGRVQRLADFLEIECDIVGVEPVAEMREQAYRFGIARDRLLDGDASHLTFPEDSFDVVTACGVLHHIEHDEQAVREMCRVARLAVFISDSNNLGQGSLPLRLVKQCLWHAGLWSLADYIKTRGRGYTFTEDDGVAYSYTVFDSVPVIRKKFPKIFYFSTEPCISPNILRSNRHVAVLATL